MYKSKCKPSTSPPPLPTPTIPTHGFLTAADYHRMSHPDEFRSSQLNNTFSPISRRPLTSPNLNDAISESSYELSIIETPPVNRTKRKSIETPIHSPIKAPRFDSVQNSVIPDDSAAEWLKDFIMPEVEELLEQEINSSQRFIEVVRTSSSTTTTPAVKISPRAQFELERNAAKKNESNVIDDDVLEAQNSQIYSSQYRREIEKKFEQCERSIAPVEESIKSFLHGIEDLNWTIEAPFPSLGPFFGLPEEVKKLIAEFKGIEQLYDWQEECLRLDSLNSRYNLIYALPTSGGKTLVAEILMLREVLCRRKNVIFVLPYVSLVQEKVLSLSPFAVELNFLVEEYAAGKGSCPPRKRRAKNSIFICTMEKAYALMDSLMAEDRSDEVGLVVVDELHLLGEKGRGAVLENLLTKVMTLPSERKVQVVGMSATIGNLEEIRKFLRADLYVRNFRPVELREFIKAGDDILEINPAATCKDDENAFIQARKVNFQYSTDALKKDPDHLAGLVQEVIPDESVLIFCATKANCVRVAILICQLLSKDLLDLKKDEKAQLIAAMERDTGSCEPELRATLPYGVAFHHSGLTVDERRHLEDAFRTGTICVICCTSTLAAGVNLPAKRVIIRSPYVGRDFLTLSRYKQMVGRAGRAGQAACGESILICPSRDNIRTADLLFSPMEKAESSLLEGEGDGLRNFLLSSIDLGIAKTRNELQEVAQKTLLAVQAERREVNVKREVDAILVDLYHKGALKMRALHRPAKVTSIKVHVESTQDRGKERPRSDKVTIKGNDQINVSSLGKAAIRACIDLPRAQRLYDDLQKAQRSLVLDSHLHLLYLVTPYDAVTTMPIFPEAFFYAFSALSEEDKRCADLIGVTEAVVVRVRLGRSLSPATDDITRRFYVTMVLYSLWNNASVTDVARRFKLGRGTIQAAMQQASGMAASIMRFCEECVELWPYTKLLESLAKRLSHCCAMELMPLMELPAVKIARAKQLFQAGFKNLRTISTTTPQQLVGKVENLSYKVAKQLISAAKAILLEKIENLKGEMEEMVDDLQQNSDFRKAEAT